MPSEPSKKTTTLEKTITYTPFGHRSPAIGENNQLGFNGEWFDTLTRQYFLGLGYRAFNPVLMRFSSPDKISPFGAGGLNSYTYCLNDPVNLSDPEGDSAIGKLWNRIKNYVRGRNHRQLVGYHGTTEPNYKSLKEGLDPTHIAGKHHGPGFYFTTDPEYAKWYADLGAKTRPGEKPIVLGVYTKDVNKLVKSKDFKYAEENSMVIQISAYKKFTIRSGTEGELHYRNSYGKHWKRKVRKSRITIITGREDTGFRGAAPKN